MANKQIQIAKPCRLTSDQHITLLAAANNGGMLKDNPSFSTRETLHYLGLIVQVRLHSDAEIAVDTRKAWASLKEAVRDKNAKLAEDAVACIRNERWRREKMAWKLTAAAEEYLMKGRVLVTAPSGSVGPTAIKRSA